MFRFFSIASGSDGNCLFIENDDTKLLIDCGISCKRIVDSLKETGVDIRDIDAILITHEHSDHIAGLNVISKRFNIPIFSNQKTLNSIIMKCPNVSNINVISGNFKINTIDVFAFPTPHDVPSNCYSFTYNNKKITIATDIGHITGEIIDAFENTDFAFIESNHDIDMLINGPYDYFLKKRILSDYGHLSNKNCSEFICSLVEKGTKRFMLGHLSKNNNTPELALNETKNVLSFFNLSAEIDVAPREHIGKIIDI